MGFNSGFKGLNVAGAGPLTFCTTSFNIQKFIVLPTMHLCVLRGFQNKQRLFLYTAFTDWFL
jgi:hypothetical protein